MGKYKDIKKKLIKAGFVFKRQAKGSHEIWLHSINKNIDPIVVPRHGSNDLKSGTEEKILKQIKKAVDYDLSNNN